MNPWQIHQARVTRRQLFGKSATGLGAAALASLLGRQTLLGATQSDASRADGQAPLPGLPHHAPTAKRVVVLWQGGGPSHVDLFDEKPAMVDHAALDDVQRICQVALFAGHQAL